jgi:hypothetical protein
MIKIKSYCKHILTATVVMSANHVYSFEFYSNGIEGSLDSQISLGSSWRVEAQDPKLSKDAVGGNGEDGNMNYKKGDVYSTIFKGSHDFQIKYDNYGAFFRGKYWYDSALKNNKVPYGHTPTAYKSGKIGAYGTDITSRENEKLDDSGFNDLAKFSGAALLDAFVYGEFEIGEMVLDARVGRQVISWGESTFILGGINAINPVDVSAFRRPGAEIKEGLIPVSMIYGNLGVSDNLSAEAFYQLEFQETVIPGCGTYFATNDYAPEGCEYALTKAGALSRAEDKKANDDGQYGLALRYVSDALDTEFGFYAMNIHSRSPVVSGITAKNASWMPEFSALTGAPYNLPASVAGSIAKASNSQYQISYPENMQLAGLSFATNVGSMAVSGEISHKLNLPVQINSTQLISSALGGTTQTASLIALGMDSTALAAVDGGILKGYTKFDVTQAQVTVIKFIDQVAGASRVSFVGEVGYTFIHDFTEGENTIRYGRSGIFDEVENKNKGFVTESSWGYRARLIATYPNAFSGINLKPILAWSDDVDGYAPQPGGSFREGQQSIGLTIKADYLAIYNASIGYTQYMGGDYSVISDRDFASISIGMQF